MLRSLRASSTGRAHFYCSSGGNAGLACAVAARTLGQPCDVFVPSLTPEHVLGKLSRIGATPHRAGTSWPEADAACRSAVASDPEGVYVPPFDHKLIWEGASSLVDELVALEDKGFFPAAGDSGDEDAGGVDAIVCSVGGGGLLNGIMTGVERHYGDSSTESQLRRQQRRPVVIAIETLGTDSLAASIRAGAHVTIPGITSVATSLGAPRVSAESYRWAEVCKATTFTFPLSSSPTPPLTPDVDAALATTISFGSTSAPALAEINTNTIANTNTSTDTNAKPTPKLVSAVVADAHAVSACTRFVDDERLLVEVACGATIASAYNPALLRAAFGFGPAGMDDEAWAKKNLVLVVCGGSSISMDMLAKYQVQFGIC